MSWGRAALKALLCWLAAIAAIAVVYGFIVLVILFPIVMAAVVTVIGFALTVWAVHL